jgi:hypothetical protein
MIITLKGADFSKHNIGTLSSWRISRSLGSGATYEGPTSVDKDAAFSATITLADGYEVSTAGVTITMGGTVLSGAHAVEGNVITITIASVTGNVLIKVPTVNTAGGDEPEEPDIPDTPDTPDEPTPVVGWFSNQIEQPSLTTPIDLSSAPYGYTDELCASYYNKPVNKIRLKVATPGTVSFGVCSADRKSIVSTYTINVVTGTDEYDIPETFTLAEGQGIWWQKKNDTGKSYCTIKANDKLGTFYSNVGTASLA